MAFFYFREKNGKFVDALRELESSPVCQSLNMQSFLMLPMQRITRLPLLMEAIHSRLQQGGNNNPSSSSSPSATAATAEEAEAKEKEMEDCREALDRLNKVMTKEALRFHRDVCNSNFCISIYFKFHMGNQLKNVNIFSPPLSSSWPNATNLPAAWSAWRRCSS